MHLLHKDIAQEIGSLLSSRKQTISVAESCTAGNVAVNLTLISGSSDYFKGGIVAYWDEIKQKLLSVDSEDIKRHSVVSNEVAKQMAHGIKDKFNTDFAIATTGYAGPNGENVGQVFIAVTSANNTIVKEYKFKGKRIEIVSKATYKALSLFLEEIKS